MLEQLIVIDYQEGAGGEFLASWLSAHLGQQLETDLQNNPNYLQKWLNSHSLIKSDWQKNFKHYLMNFNELCGKHNVQRICIPYHLYKWPDHVEILQKINQAKFVRINVEGYESIIEEDFKRKVFYRVLKPQDFAEIKFILGPLDQDKRNHFLDLFRQGRLTYGELFPNINGVKRLPSTDIEIKYGDFFSDFTKSTDAYNKLCNQLQIPPDLALLSRLVDRNKKNLQNQQKHLSTL